MPYRRCGNGVIAITARALDRIEQPFRLIRCTGYTGRMRARHAACDPRANCVDLADARQVNCAYRSIKRLKISFNWADGRYQQWSGKHEPLPACSVIFERKVRIRIHQALDMRGFAKHHKRQVSPPRREMAVRYGNAGGAEAQSWPWDFSSVQGDLWTGSKPKCAAIRWS